VKIQAFSIITKRCDFKLMNTVKRFKRESMRSLWK